MKYLPFFMLCFLGFSSRTFAQTYLIAGTVEDTLAAPLANATVMLLQARDSVLSKFGLTDGEGRFEIKSVEAGSYLLRVTYLGYEQYDRPVVLPPENGSRLDLGRFALQTLTESLEEVIVKGERNPISLQQDTIVYNAGAFRTQPNDAVEDLLKKLPGIEVERDGTVKAQGEEVQKVYVDGKEFFGDDPKIATKNLPADAIDKIAVYDKKSELAEFSGVDDGVRQKAINLELKEDRKKGVFGNIRAGYGDMARFDSKASINKFAPKNQFSLIGMGNNVNEQGFSYKDYFQFMGGLQNLMSGGGSFKLELNDGSDIGLPLNFGNDEGFFTTYAGGLNFNSELSEKTEANGSYFYNRMDNRISRNLLRQNFLPDGEFINTEESLNTSLNNNHRFNVNIDHDMDSIQSIRFRTNFTHNATEAGVSSSSVVSGPDGLTENEGDRTSTSAGEALNWNADLFYRRRFGKPGRLFTANVNFGIRENEADGRLEAINRFFADGNLLQADTISQTNLQESDNRSWEGRLTFLEPLGKKKYLELSYSHGNIFGGINREVYDQPDSENGAGIFNRQLSNQYETVYSYNRGGIGLRLNRDKLKFSTGLELQQSRLDGQLLLTGTAIEQSLLNLLPKLRLGFDFDNTNNLNFFYNTSVRQPSIRELQPIEDNSNPLNIYVGNPDLKPEYRHNAHLRYLLFDRFSFTKVFATMRYTYTENKIKITQSIDEKFVRTNRPLNVRSDHDFNSDISFGTPIRPLGINFDIDLEGAFNRGITFINAVENDTRRTTIGGSLRLANRKTEVVEISVGAKWSYTTTRYSISSDFDQDFINQVYYADLDLNLPGGFQFRSTFDLSVYQGRSNGFNDNIPLWNASISKFLLPNQQLQLRMAVTDLLDQNVGLSRRAELNYIEDERINSLGRYFMFSLIYAIKGFGSGDGVIKIEEDRF